ncbi:hypothetical protein [Salinilacihabitans rarus]|uniref:hypothetical protein n=1 Tax=Salinilacihabitans rarus TaxID=2961596 RepID=UPI0020C84C08|nr:hypothetical protein [Salinilacihabitans rarus]
MGARTDGALAAVALAAFAAAFVAVDAAPSVPAFLLGAAGTLAFEAVAARRAAAVRRYWERRAVQVASLAGALALVAVGAAVAPSPLLSAGGGALAAYFLLLALVRAGAVPPPRAWT